MPKENLTKLTLPELKVKENMLKKAVILFWIAVVIMFLSAAFLMIRKGFGVFTILPLVFLPLAIVFTANLKAVKEEIRLRIKP